MTAEYNERLRVWVETTPATFNFRFWKTYNNMSSKNLTVLVVSFVERDIRHEESVKKSSTVFRYFIIYLFIRMFMARLVMLFVFQSM
jgi:hypothetical protein